jgi:thiol-disulfide isomerase/thioredoxin
MEFKARLLAIALLVALPAAVPAAGDAPIFPEYAGKVIFVDFWASWCVPCRRSFPWLNEMYHKYGDDGLVIVGVNLDQARSDADAFLADLPPDFRIVYDTDKTLAQRFEVMAMPTSYLIGRDGRQIERHLGFKVRKQAEYESAIVAALNGEE